MLKNLEGCKLSNKKQLAERNRAALRGGKHAEGGRVWEGQNAFRRGPGDRLRQSSWAKTNGARRNFMWGEDGYDVRLIKLNRSYGLVVLDVSDRHHIAPDRALIRRPPTAPPTYRECLVFMMDDQRFGCRRPRFVLAA